jgi:two-component system CheB/CheR fusion protein
MAAAARGKRSRPSEPAKPKKPPPAAGGPPAEPVPSRLGYCVVGIGASAGGVEACSALLAALPDDTGMAFVVVLHLDPSHPSYLSEVLGRATRLRVSEAAEGESVEPNRVYVIPPGTDLGIHGGRLELTRRSAPSGQHRPIDGFLRTLAEDQGHQAIGVILSGSATDGTLGLEAVKAEGGITFAQDDTAQHGSMPHSAIAAGCVDLVLAPREIARELARIARHPYVGTGEAPSAEALREVDLRRVIELVRSSMGVDFGQYKRQTLTRRITRRMVLHKLEGLKDYVRLLQANPAEVEALYQDVLISVTTFFRNPEAFEVVKARVFPRLTADRSHHEPLRIWTVGCSSGEEAYSLAIAFAEFASDTGRTLPVQIFATDLNGAGVERARAGLYPKTIAADVSPERLRRFFVEVDGSYRVAKAIRDVCVFARHNAIADPPFSHLDMVTCRNLLIYLEPALQQQLLPVLHYALRPLGVLWLGASETIGAHRDLFELEDAKHKIYVRRPGASRVPAPARESFFATPPSAPPTSFAPPAEVPQPPLQVNALREADRFLLNRFAPPGVLVSADFDVLQFRGDNGPYLAPAAGRASFNLLKMLREGLIVGVRNALQRAKRGESPARETGLRVRSNGGYRLVDVEVTRMATSPLREATFLLLFLEPASPPEAGPAPAPDPGAPSTKDEILRLEHELAATRDYLQAVIEQQEAANEELQSANEEVQSANEELQSINEELETSKEEIQSSNEELSTVNDELQSRNVELARSNNDLANLLASVDTAIVMLGPDLRIRRLTPRAEKLLRLMPGDVGRPLADLKLPLDLDDLDRILDQVLETVQTQEREVRDRDGRWHLLRVRPYRTADHRIDGAVLLLVDIDRVKRAQRLAEAIIDNMPEPVLVLDEELEVVRASELFYAAFGGAVDQTEKRSFFDVMGGTWDRPELRARIHAVRDRREHLVDFEVEAEGADGTLRTLHLSAIRLRPELADEPLIVVSMRDVSARKRLEVDLRRRIDELAAADQDKTQFLAMLAHELRNPLAPIRSAVEVMKLPQAGEADRAQARDLVARQVDHMARILEDLLDVSRISRGRIQLRREPLRLAEVLERSVESVRPTLRARAQTLELSGLDELGWVRGDAVRLEQVFFNLIGNASKFSPRGTEIAVAAEQLPAQDGVPARARVRVRDHGMGIEPENLERVFDLFMQADRSLDRSQGGLGIGLTLVRRLVEKHGGSVKAASDGKDMGSEFVVELPLLPDGETQAKAAEAGHRVESAPIVGRRILVVDDNVDAAESLALALRLAGHEVAVAYDGEAAIARALAHPPDLVLLDIGLPRLDGFETARQMREHSELDSTIIAALTGYGREEDRRAAARAGVDHYLMKPFHFELLPQLFAPGPERPE